ncbi:MAG: hypothetical protein J0J05_06870 [Microbacterium sp.]|uniref:hypothetical protein n=1 Tax=Microbacterium sp. TaxID=51671 RepID=UPI001AC141B4|nr:hypothetical protein [Microbacterium sp.]MBN9153686.1 hypothetical protein [Microbacterium sp.]
MVFVLDGGPRAGQLVDDLPTGYRAQGGVHGASPALFDDVFADVAVWAGGVAAPADPS